MLAARPAQATLVPDAPAQLTSDHGWDAVAERERLSAMVARLRAGGIRVSLFLDPTSPRSRPRPPPAPTASSCTPRPTPAASPRGVATEAVAPYAAAARRAQELGLGVNAGHDLNLANLAPLLAAVPGVLEVSIGHAFICECFDFGLEGTVDRYLAVIGTGR